MIPNVINKVNCNQQSQMKKSKTRIMLKSFVFLMNLQISNLLQNGFILLAITVKTQTSALGKMIHELKQDGL